MDPRLSAGWEPSSEAIITCDAEGRIIEATPSACDLTGYTLDELRSLSLEDLGFESSPGADAAQWLGRLHDDSVLTLPMDLHRKDGRRRPVRLRVSRDPSPGSGRALVRMRHRRRAAELLDEDEGFVRAVLQATGSLLLVLGRDDRILYLNRSCEEFIGQPFSRVRGKTVGEVLGACWATTGGSLKDFRLPASGEADWTVQGGSTRRIAWSLSALELRQEPKGCRLLTGVDITALRELEKRSLHEAALVSFCGDALLSMSLDGIVTSWNRAAERLYGYSAAEIVGRPIAVLVPPDRRDEPQKLLDRIRRGESIQNYDTVRLRKDGTPLEVSLNLEAIQGRQGEVTGVVGVVHDLSERRHFENSLQESERHLLHLLDEMPLALWTTDRNLEITYCAGRLYATDPLAPAPSLVGQRVDQLFPPSSAAVDLHQKALEGIPGRYTLEIE